MLPITENWASVTPCRFLTEVDNQLMRMAHDCQWSVLLSGDFSIQTVCSRELRGRGGPKVWDKFIWGSETHQRNMIKRYFGYYVKSGCLKKDETVWGFLTFGFSFFSPSRARLLKGKGSIRKPESWVLQGSYPSLWSWRWTKWRALVGTLNSHKCSENNYRSWEFTHTRAPTTELTMFL